MTDKTPSRGQGGWKQLAKAALRMLLKKKGLNHIALLLAVGLLAGLI